VGCEENWRNPSFAAPGVQELASGWPQTFQVCVPRGANRIINRRPTGPPLARPFIAFGFSEQQADAFSA